MKKFRFRLDKVLQYRSLVRDEKRKVLAKRNAELREAQEHLEELERKFLANNIPEGTSVTIEELQLRGLYGVRIKDAIVNQRLGILDAEQKVEEARAEYLEAEKEAQALEKLKAKRLGEYQEYVSKEEEKFLDELTTQKGNRISID